MMWMLPLPTFSIEWGGSGSDGSTVAGDASVGTSRESTITLPRSSRRTKLLHPCTTNTAGQRWVWTGVPVAGADERVEHPDAVVFEEQRVVVRGRDEGVELVGPGGGVGGPQHASPPAHPERGPVRPFGALPPFRAVIPQLQACSCSAGLPPDADRGRHPVPRGAAVVHGVWNATRKRGRTQGVVATMASSSLSPGVRQARVLQGLGLRRGAVTCP